MNKKDITFRFLFTAATASLILLPYQPQVFVAMWIFTIFVLLAWELVKP